MKLTQLKVNHLKNPLGFSVKNPSFSFQVAESSGSTLKAARIRIAEKEDMSELLYDSGITGMLRRKRTTATREPALWNGSKAAAGRAGTRTG